MGTFKSFCILFQVRFVIKILADSAVASLLSVSDNRQPIGNERNSSFAEHGRVLLNLPKFDVPCCCGSPVSRTNTCQRRVFKLQSFQFSCHFKALYLIRQNRGANCFTILSKTLFFSGSVSYIKAPFFLILFTLTMRIFLSECSFEVCHNAAIVTALLLSCNIHSVYGSKNASTLATVAGNSMRFKKGRFLNSLDFPLQFQRKP